MINKARLVNRFIEYASCASESGHELQMCLRLEHDLASLGMEVVRDKVSPDVDTDGWNVLAFLPGEGEPLLLSAHMDTVPPGIGITPIIRDEVICSSGNTVLGADDKAGISEIMEALTCLKEDRLSHRPLEVLFTVREETGLEGSKNADFSRIKSKVGLSFDSGSIGRIVIETPIHQVLFLEIQGRAAHSGRHYNDGVHALKCAADIISQLPCGHVDADTAVNVANFMCPGSANTVPDKATFEVEIRCFDPEKLEAYRARLKEILDGTTTAYHAQYSFRTESHSPGMRLPKEHPLVEQVSGVYEALGLTPKIVRTYGGHDGISFAGHGLAAVNIGCGFTNCHSAEEYVKIDDLIMGARIALSLMTERPCPI